MTNDTHIYVLLKMVIRNIPFFPVKSSVHNECLTGNSLELNRWTDFMTRAGRVYWPDRTKYHVVSGVLPPSFVHSFPLSFFSMHSHPGWQVQAHGCYDSLSEYIHNTLSLFLSVSLTRKSCCSCSLSACCTFPSHSSSSSIILSLSALLPFLSSQTLIATRLSKPPQQHLSPFAPPISTFCHFLFPFCIPLSPLFSVASVPKPQIHSSVSVFLSHVCALSFLLSFSISPYLQVFL